VILEELLDIQKVKVSPERLQAFEDEHDFNSLAVEFLIEVGSYLTIACNVYPASGRWNNLQAAISGNGIRLWKLLNALLDQTCQHRREVSEILTRLLFETAVTIRFLILNQDSDVLSSYISHAFKYERELRRRITSNVALRGGSWLPIEKRMLESIDNAIRDAGITEGELAKIPRNWGGKNLFEKAVSVEWEAQYLAVFSGMSNAVHGSWTDIRAHHLEEVDYGFKGVFEWTRPRPQQLNACCTLIATVCDEIFSF
jgi:hypothetical protein